MVQRLLADRFKLVVHRETRQSPIYALVLARSDGTRGPKLTPSTTDCAALAAAAARGAAPPAPPANPNGRPLCGTRTLPGRILAGGVTMDDLARNVSNFAGRMTLNRTGLQGRFDLELEFTARSTATRRDAAAGTAQTAGRRAIALYGDARAAWLEARFAAGTGRRARDRCGRPSDAGLIRGLFSIRTAVRSADRFSSPGARGYSRPQARRPPAARRPTPSSPDRARRRRRAIDAINRVSPSEPPRRWPSPTRVRTSPRPKTRRNRLPSARAERGADSDLMRALRDRIRDHAVDADAREQQRHGRRRCPSSVDCSRLAAIDSSLI